MTYKLWVNGTEHGPYTRDEIQGQHERGELVGILWRRVGESRFHPHTEIEAELAAPPEIAAQAGRPEPSGESTGGQLAIAFGILILVCSLVGVLISPIVAAFSGVGVALITLGYLAQIQAKLELIAHRLRRE